MTHRAFPAAQKWKTQWVRTCVGCRKRAPASELLRVVAVGGEAGPAGAGPSLVPDPARRMPGRGAHLHPDPGCLGLALRRGAFGRALRLSSVPDAGALVELLGGNTTADGHGPDSKDRTTDMNTR